VILADDLGFSDLGCYGSEIATPNIDRLAQDGVRFRQFYNNGRCCPSRASLLTGRYPHQVGIGAMVDEYARWIREAADSPSYQDHLSADSPTIPELLRLANYRTMMCGKWHLGYRPKEWPARRGFDRSFVLIPGAMNYFGGETSGSRASLVHDDKRITPPLEGFYSTDAFTDRAIEFLAEAKNKDQPFFLYLAYNAPHWPLQAPSDEIEKYRGKYDVGWQPTREARMRRMVDLGVVDAEHVRMAPMDRGKTPPWNKLSDAQRDEWALRMSVYAAQVSRLDENVGRLLDELTRLGVADNTLVLFISDNGGAPEDPHRGQPNASLGTRESYWGYARPWATVSNTPWRNHKVTAYEGGISGPAIACWPAQMPEEAKGRLVDGPAHLIDLMPTFLELAGQTYPASESIRLEGRSILDMIKGQPGATDRKFCWEHEGNRAIRKGKWKLVMLADAANGWELYDIAADRSESNKLAAAHPEIVRNLAAEYERWATRCGVVTWPQIAAQRPATGK